MTKTDQDYIEANRQSWDAAAPHHKASARYQHILDGFKQAGHSCLDDLLTERLLKLGIAGKDIGHLCCNDGCELLSVKNLGAGRCVGFDQSGGFLDQARMFQVAAGIDCDFVETDVHKIDPAFNGTFDIVLITIGVFGWMPNLKRFVAVASRLLRKGGAVCIYEQHPIINMMEPYDLPDDPERLVHSYFKEAPFEDAVSYMYDGTASWDGPVKYWFVHTLSDIMTALLDEGLAIEVFEEYPHNISSAEYDLYNDQTAQLPQSYMLVARKGT